MMFKLQQNWKMGSYTPPIPVPRMGGVDREAPVPEQIESLLWLPALLVSKFIGQYPCLLQEADELFSIAVLKVAETVADESLTGSPVNKVCLGRCIYAMESYCNNLDSVVTVSTSTRYANRRKQIPTPKHTPEQVSTGQCDDHTELLIRDACDVFGYDPKDLTLKQKRKLWEVLS